MTKRILMTTILLTICSVTAGLKSPVFALEMDLVGLLTKNLGVTDQQADGIKMLEVPLGAATWPGASCWASRRVRPWCWCGDSFPGATTA